MPITQITLCFVCLFRLTSDSAHHTDHIVFRLFVSINIRQCASHRSHCVSFVCFNQHQTVRITQITLCFVCLFRLTSDSAHHTDHIVFRLFISINIRQCASHRSHCVSFVCFNQHQTVRITQITLCFVCLFRLTSDSAYHTNHIVFCLFVSINIRQCASHRSHCVSFVCFNQHQTVCITQITLCFVCLFRLTSDHAHHTDHI